MVYINFLKILPQRQKIDAAHASGVERSKVKVIPSYDLLNGNGDLSEIVEPLKQGGIICYPDGNSYRLAVDAGNETAITHLLQAKKRVSQRPSLMIIPDKTCLNIYFQALPTPAQKVVDKLWPKPVTLRLELSSFFSKKAARSISAGTGKIGVRLAHTPIAKKIIDSFAKPIIVTSANPSGKTGANSVAAIKKNFFRLVDVLIDGGDVQFSPSSTILDFQKEQTTIVREGSIPKEEVFAIL
jgi:L-threonylcarbamoyladenylate synthase